MMICSCFRILVLLLILPYCCGAGPAYGADAAVGKKQELQRIKREMQDKKRRIKLANKRERSVLAGIEKTDREIQAGGAELAEQQRRLRDAESSLRDIEKSSGEINADLTGLRRTYSIRIRALYKMRHKSYAAVVLGSESFTGALKGVKYLGMIAEQDRRIMLHYGEALERLSVRQKELAAKKEEVLKRSKLVEAKKTALETQRQKKAGILSRVREEKDLYEQTLNELQESSISLWAMIRKAEQEKKAAKPARNKVRRSTDSAVASGTNRFPWPVQGQVLTRFGMQRHPQFGTTVFRRGIEIEAREGNAVRAMDAGQVAYSDWYKGYGKLVILEHPNGLYSLYGHLSRLDVNNGDRVEKEQVVGLAGETGSMKGPRLYFEIRHNGEAVDPLAWLAKR